MRRWRTRLSSPSIPNGYVHNLLSLKSFYRVLVGNAHVYSVKSRIGRVSDSHRFRTAFTMAKIPALIGSGRLPHASTTLIKSSGKSGRLACTHVAQFGCTDLSRSCSGNVALCIALSDAEAGNTPICLVFAGISATSVSEMLLWKEDRWGGDSRRLHSPSAPDLVRSGALLFSGGRSPPECACHLAGQGDQHFISTSRRQERQANR
jgi:hypothetical protein